VLASHWGSRWVGHWARSASNCPKTGAEYRPLSSQVHLKTCQSVVKAAKRVRRWTGRSYET
jgi:hypothetical protein